MDFVMTKITMLIANLMVAIVAIMTIPNTTNTVKIVRNVPSRITYLIQIV